MPEKHTKSPSSSRGKLDSRSQKGMWCSSSTTEELGNIWKTFFSPCHSNCQLPWVQLLQQAEKPDFNTSRIILIVLPPFIYFLAVKSIVNTVTLFSKTFKFSRLWKIILAFNLKDKENNWNGKPAISVSHQQYLKNDLLLISFRHCTLD